MDKNMISKVTGWWGSVNTALPFQFYCSESCWLLLVQNTECFVFSKLA